ncbi:MAG: type II toxin-antitoxin system HicB family antitoxin [Candidatus Nealsonbacteria bacterium]|nr:type II toxin-antitoxin system HicB family antitoxin [Candidatus Nealsonbacteria bacterium]
MTDADKYVKIVEWSDTDGCFIGSCPELFYGGCHGNESRAVFAELCDVVDETVAIYKEDGRELPPPMSGKEFVNQMQRIS